MKVLHSWARKGTARASLTWPLTGAIVSGILGEKRRNPYKKIAGTRRGRGNGFLLHLPSLPVEKACSRLRHLLSPPPLPPQHCSRGGCPLLCIWNPLHPGSFVFLYHFASVCTPSKDRHPLQGTHSLKTRCQTGHQGVTTSKKEGEVSCPDLALNIQNCGQEQRGFLSCSLAFGTSLTQGWGGTG